MNNLKLNSDTVSSFLGLMAGMTEILANKGFQPECNFIVSGICIAGLGYLCNKATKN
jgi:hypothetical protein